MNTYSRFFILRTPHARTAPLGGIVALPRRNRASPSRNESVVMTNLPKDEQEAAVGAAVRADDEAAFQFDPVAVEIQRWSYLAPEELQQFYTTDGLLNEFKMLWHLRHRFPLHMVVFKLTACHLPHEANVERYFSRAGALSDPNMNPDFLGKLVMVGANQKRYAPSVQSIKEHYFAKYRGKGGEHEDNEE